jgi:hypothetical protein
MTSLFTKHERYTTEACKLKNQLKDALEPILKDYNNQGYSLREISIIAHHAITESECWLILDKEVPMQHREQSNYV